QEFFRESLLRKIAVRSERRKGMSDQKARIFLVESDFRLRRMAQTALEAAGHEVIEAGSVVEALLRIPKLNNFRPNVAVISDYLGESRDSRTDGRLVE